MTARQLICLNDPGYKDEQTLVDLDQTIFSVF